MLQLTNQSSFKATFAILPDANGTDTAYAYVRGEFDLKGNLLPGDMQEPPRMEDEHYGDPDTTSVKFPSDLTLGKPATDVLLIGSAKAPKGNLALVKLVRLRVGTAIDKTLVVTGNRVWKDNFLGFRKASDPEPFASMPLGWENAYGGSDQVKDDESTRKTCHENPHGCGFNHPDQPYRVGAGRKLPNIEHADKRIRSWKDHPTPAGFGAIAPTWKPRSGYAGTYDEAWEKSRSPFLPKDFDPRFFQAAQPDQIVAGHLHGGEPVEIDGVTDDGAPVKFSIPSCTPLITFRFADGDHAASATLETVAIDTDENRVTLVWAAHQPYNTKNLKRGEILIQNQAQQPAPTTSS